MPRKTVTAPYKCLGCQRPFAGLLELQQHHAGCLKFIALRDGVRRTKQSMRMHEAVPITIGGKR